MRRSSCCVSVNLGNVNYILQCLDACNYVLTAVFPRLKVFNIYTGIIWRRKCRVISNKEMALYGKNSCWCNILLTLNSYRQHHLCRQRLNKRASPRENFFYNDYIKIIEIIEIIEIQCNKVYSPAAISFRQSPFKSQKIVSRIRQ